MQNMKINRKHLANGKIGVFDSGIGGLTILEELKKILPNEKYMFYADSKNCPYGEKSDDDLYNITSNVVEYLIQNDCKIIIIACNTATTRCIKYLREKYSDVIFVGTEPAIKFACDKDYKNILVMATPATITSEKINILVNENKKEYENIFLVPCEGLADAIETNNLLKQETIISSIYNEYKDKDVDVIVLGCTHYPYLLNILTKYAPEELFIDPAICFAQFIKNDLQKSDLLCDNNANRTEEFYVSSSPEKFQTASELFYDLPQKAKEYIF